MFTGLIAEQGKIISLSKSSRHMELCIGSKAVLAGIKVGDSIAVDGVCLTVTSFDNSSFSSDVIPETFERTNLKNYHEGEDINLEKSVTLQDTLGGHLVTGDVDCVGTISTITTDETAIVIEITPCDEAIMRYIVVKGRIAVDGASLTVLKATDKSFSLGLVPHTQRSITLASKNIGAKVNIETDLIAKHVEKLLMTTFSSHNKDKKSNISLEWLHSKGFK